MVHIMSHVDGSRKGNEEESTLYKIGPLTSPLNSTDMCNKIENITSHWMITQIQYHFTHRSPGKKTMNQKTDATGSLKSRIATDTNCAELGHENRRNLGYFSLIPAQYLFILTSQTRTVHAR